MIEAKLEYDDHKNRRTTIRVHDNELFQSEAKLASVLIEKWGMVQAVENGEDSSGRARMRLATPEEVIVRACDTAELALKTFREKGWVLNTPSLAEFEKFRDGISDD